mmetsp:Transcript_119342/g.234449  ORF Transcript_119342/g.234449 Transcript_119342/m.234449 type:complete len:238 (-) Transcript_119342:205-918(-)
MSRAFRHPCIHMSSPICSMVGKSQRRPRSAYLSNARRERTSREPYSWSEPGIGQFSMYNPFPLSARSNSGFTFRKCKLKCLGKKTVSGSSLVTKSKRPPDFWLCSAACAQASAKGRRFSQVDVIAPATPRATSKEGKARVTAGRSAEGPPPGPRSTSRSLNRRKSSQEKSPSPFRRWLCMSSSSPPVDMRAAKHKSFGMKSSPRTLHDQGWRYCGGSLAWTPGPHERMQLAHFSSFS